MKRGKKSLGIFTMAYSVFDVSLPFGCNETVKYNAPLFKKKRTLSFTKITGCTKGSKLS